MRDEVWYSILQLTLSIFAFAVSVPEGTPACAATSMSRLMNIGRLPANIR